MFVDIREKPVHAGIIVAIVIVVAIVLVLIIILAKKVHQDKVKRVVFLSVI